MLLLRFLLFIAFLSLFCRSLFEIIANPGWQETPILFLFLIGFVTIPSFLVLTFFVLVPQKDVGRWAIRQMRRFSKLPK